MKGKETVTFTVSALGQIETKAIADGLNVDVLHYEVYSREVDVSNTLDGTDGPVAKGYVAMTKTTDPVDGQTYNTATVDLDLLKDQDLTILFWAHVNGTGYYDVQDLRSVKIQKTPINANDESRAAFYKRVDFNTNDDNMNYEVELVRPFAQLNLGTTPESLTPTQQGETKGYTIEVLQSEVTVVGLSNTFDLVNGKALEGTETVTYTLADTPYQQDNKEVLTVQEKDFHYVAMNYLFVPNGDKLVNLSYKVVTDKGTIQNEIINVPVKQNYRTNIIGNLLTTNTAFEIVVDEDFLKEDVDLKYEADGITLVNPDLDADPATYTRMYEISTANGFAYAMMEIVPGLNAGENVEFYLLKSIDMSEFDYVSPTVPSGASVLLATGPSPVTKSADPIVITGLSAPIFAVVEQDAVVVFSGIKVECEPGVETAFVGENNGKVEIIQSEATTEGEEGDVDFIGGGSGSALESAGAAEDILATLAKGYSVQLESDVTIKASLSNAYGATGINVHNGQTIDGAGHTLTVTGAGGTWDSAINTTGGVIKNLTVKGAFRGIFVNHTSTYSEKVILENVIIDGPVYTISCDQGMNQGLEATGSEFYGWTSYAGTIGTVLFTDCIFGEGSGYAFCRPYAPTSFVGCEFEAGYKLDAAAAVTFKNCTLNGEAITAENLATLVSSNITNATVVE